MYVTGVEGLESEEELNSLYTATWGEKDQVLEGFLYDSGYLDMFSIDFIFDGE